MSVSPRPTQQVGNWLLDALPSEEYERLKHDLEPVSFALGDVIYESSAHMDYVYFPTSSHISLLYIMLNGSTAEMGLVGNEGVVGIALFMGGETTPNRAMVQGSGEAFRIEGLSEVPDWRPSPRVGRLVIPRRIRASGGCMLTTSAEPGQPSGPEPRITRMVRSSTPSAGSLMRWW